MNRLFLWCVILAAVIFTISCPMAEVQNPYEELPAGTFWAQNFKTAEYYTVESVLLAAGEKCAVWAEKNAGISVATGKAIAREFDRNIYPVIVPAFGSDDLMRLYDVDKDGKLTLLLLDIQDGFSGSGAYTAGYFYQNDLLLSSSSNHSNERDMIYVDVNPSKLPSKESYATIAHELQHFINYAIRSSKEYAMMDTWIDEGLSAAAEYLYLKGHNEERVTQFTLSETVRQGNNFFVWGDRPDNVLDDYSTVYLFFQWLRIQSGGPAIYRRIIESSSPDYRAVTGAITGDFAQALGSASWEATLRSWLAANYINSPTGLYGYHGELPELHVWALGGTTQKLLAGEGVYSMAGNSPGALPSSGGQNIKYAGLRKATVSPQRQDPAVSLKSLYPEGRLLTFNSNANNARKNDRDRETGMLTGLEGETIPSSKTGRSAWPGRDSWAVDARDIMGRAVHGNN